MIRGMPRLTGPLGCRSCARSRLTSFREAASRLTFKPWPVILVSSPLSGHFDVAVSGRSP